MGSSWVFLVQICRGGGLNTPFFTRLSFPRHKRLFVCMHTVLPRRCELEWRLQRREVPLYSNRSRTPPSLSCPLVPPSESRKGGMWLRRSAAGWMSDSKVWSRREALLFRNQSESSRDASILKYEREKRASSGFHCVLWLLKYSKIGTDADAVAVFVGMLFYSWMHSQFWELCTFSHIIYMYIKHLVIIGYMMYHDTWHIKHCIMDIF